MIVTVVGLGVIGGSYVQALHGLGYEVYGVDINKDTLDKAKRDGYIIEGYADGHEIIAKSDLVIICLYPSLMIDFIKRHSFKKGSIITDVVGIKSYFLDDVFNLLNNDVEFVSGHPMAGREKKGYEYASKDVFNNANYIIIEHPKNTTEAIAFLHDLVSKIGFKSVKIMSPHAHDEVISFTSQLPHMIAVALMNSDAQKYETGKYIGDSFRDLTRIANINEDLWTELFLNNKDYLLASMNQFEEQFDKLREALVDADEQTLKECFIESTKRREELEK